MLDSDDSGNAKAETSVIEDIGALSRAVRIVGDGHRVLVIGHSGSFPKLLRDRHCQVTALSDMRADAPDSYDVVVFGNLADCASPVESLREARRYLAPSGYVLGLAANAMHCANRLALLGANPAIVAPCASLSRVRLVEIFEAADFNIDSVDFTTHLLAEPSPLLPPLDLSEFSPELVDALIGGKDSEILTFLVKGTPFATAPIARIASSEPETVVTLKRELAEQRQALEKAMGSIDALGGKLGSFFAQVEATPEQRVIALDRFRAPQEVADFEKFTIIEGQLRAALHREHELMRSRDEATSELIDSRAAITESRHTVERLEAQLRNTDGTLHELRAELKILGRLNAESERAVLSLRSENQSLRDSIQTSKALITSLIGAIGSLEEEVLLKNAHVVNVYRMQHNAIQQQMSELNASPFWAVKMVVVSLRRIFLGG